jgi:hypothetical protein
MTANQPAEPRRIRAVGGEREVDPGSGFPDSYRDLQQSQPDGGEVTPGERLRPGNGFADLLHQPVGRRVQDQSHLIGERRAATGAVGCQLAFVPLDQVLRLTHAIAKIELRLTPDNVNNTTSVPDLTQDVIGKLFG